MLLRDTNFILFDPRQFRIDPGEFAQARRVLLEGFRSEKPQRVKPVLDAQGIRLARVNYRDVVLEKENAKRIVEATGATYFNSHDGQFGASLTPADQQDLIRDFFVYTMMPNNAFSFAFADSMSRGAMIDDWISVGLRSLNGLKRLETIGFTQLRESILGEDPYKKIQHVKDFGHFMQELGVGTNDKTEKAVYRWGIRATAAELRKKGIFYVPAGKAEEKDKIYLVDPGGKRNWGTVMIKFFRGNKLDSVRLGNYPNIDFQKQFLEKLYANEPRIKMQELTSEYELAEFFKELGFEVPGLAETENFILAQPQLFQNYLETKLADITQKGEARLGTYIREVAMKYAAWSMIYGKTSLYDSVKIYKPMMTEDANISADQRSSRRYLSYNFRGTPQLAAIEYGGKSLSAQAIQNLKADARELGATPCVIIFDKDINVVSRRIDGDSSGIRITSLR